MQPDKKINVLLVLFFVVLMGFVLLSDNLYERYQAKQEQLDQQEELNR